MRRTAGPESRRSGPAAVSIPRAVLDQMSRRHPRAAHGVRCARGVEAAALATASTGWDLALAILHHGDAVVATRPALRPHWVQVAFLVRVLSVYHRCARGLLEPAAAVEEIDKLQIPSVDGPSAWERDQELRDRQQMYRALCWLGTDPGTALAGLDRLWLAGRRWGALIVNRLAAQLALAGPGEGDRRTLLERAVAEWDRAWAKLLPREAELVGSKARLNRLHAAALLGRAQEFERLLAESDPVERTQIEWVDVVARFAYARGQADRARKLVAEAVALHRRLDGSLHPELSRLSEHVERAVPSSPIAAAVELGHGMRRVTRAEYLELMDRDAAAVVGVVSRGGDLNAFLAEQVVSAVLGLRTRNAHLMRVQRDENRTNDLLQSLLEAGLRFLRWEVSDQPRGGVTAKATESGLPCAGLGERDVVIPDRGRTLAVDEALVLDSVRKDEIRKHVLKVFTYDAQACGRWFVVVYACATDFEGLWRGYLECVEGIGEIARQGPPPELFARATACEWPPPRTRGGSRSGPCTTSWST